jgi:adhesin HecA-like repeat protein
MTTRYARTRTTFEGSLATDYSKPFVDDGYESTFASDDGISCIPVKASTTGTTLDLATWSTISQIMIRNTDTTNFILAEFYAQVGTYAAGDLTLTKAAPDTILDNNGGDMSTTPEYGSAGMYARVANGTNSDNDGLFLIQSLSDSGATNDLITLAQDNTFDDTEANDATATISFESRTKLKIPATKLVNYEGNVVAASDLVLRADTSAVDCYVYIVGTLA